MAANEQSLSSPDTTVLERFGVIGTPSFRKFINLHLSNDYAKTHCPECHTPVDEPLQYKCPEDKCFLHALKILRDQTLDPTFKEFQAEWLKATRSNADQYALMEGWLDFVPALIVGMPASDWQNEQIINNARYSSQTLTTVAQWRRYIGSKKWVDDYEITGQPGPAPPHAIKSKGKYHGTDIALRNHGTWRRFVTNASTAKLWNDQQDKEKGDKVRYYVKAHEKNQAQYPAA